MIVPSACDTRKRFGEDGTQRTAVQGELDMRPCDMCLFHRALENPTPPDNLTCLFNRPYRNENGSMTMSFVLGWRVFEHKDSPSHMRSPVWKPIISSKCSWEAVA